jgi:hypothetical protein
LIIQNVCRAFNQEREETSHLYAYCTKLAQIRMKVCGTIFAFSGNFGRTPQELLKMAKELDNICPEEGQTTTQSMTPPAQNMSNRTITE